MTSTTDSPTGGPGGGVSRRALIQRAALAGAVAWTAPVVIGSLASPAGAATPCVCANASNYTAGKVENISPSGTGGCVNNNGGVINGTLGFTGNNRGGAACWSLTNGSPSSATGTAPTFTCGNLATLTGFTINLPGNCTWGDKGMVSVFFGGGIGSYNYYVETTLPAGYTCTNGGVNNPGTLAADGTSFTLTSELASVLGTNFSKLSHVNVIYCCC